MKQFTLALCLVAFAVVANAQEAKTVVTPINQKVSTVVQEKTPANAAAPANVQEKKPAIEPAPSVVAQPVQEVPANPGVVQAPVQGSVVQGSTTSGCCPPVVNNCCCPQRPRFLSRLRSRFGVRRCR